VASSLPNIKQKRTRHLNTSLKYLETKPHYSIGVRGEGDENFFLLTFSEILRISYWEISLKKSKDHLSNFYL